MTKKFYAIKEGFDFEQNEKIENKIVYSWNDCLRYVKGVKGAKYKSFTSIEEAEKYLNSGSDIIKKDSNNYPQNQPHFYVDGSYNDSTEIYSYALVVVVDGVIVHIENGAAKDNKNKAIRQIAGELEASIKSIEYAAENEFKNIVILHDYLGVCYHATGFWERKEESSKTYYETYNRLIKENGINVTFVKVDSHTGDLFNEVVDEFAKAAINVTLKKETEKYLKNNVIKVKNDNIKELFKQIVSNNALDNIEVMEYIDKAEENENLNKLLNEKVKKIKNMVEKDRKMAEEYIKCINSGIKDELIYFLVNKFIK